MGTWRTLIVDVELPISDVAMEGSDHLHVTALAGSRPLGSIVLPAPLDPFPAPLLADALIRNFAAAWHEATTEESFDHHRPDGGEVTTAVLVCTRDRPESLARCLRSIAALDARIDEVIVVDNASTGPATREVVEAAGARYVAEPVPGLDRARNRGFAETTAEVVLCTDDDVEVDTAWATRLLDCFTDPLVMAATGLVLPARLDTEARQRFEEHAGFSRGTERRVFDGAGEPASRAGAAGAGASMALRTSAVRRLGGFPEELDAGTPTASGGDTAIVYEVLRCGFRVVYEPRALAYHHHRNDPDALHRVLRGYGTGLYAFFTHGVVRHGDLDLLVAAARWSADRLLKGTARALTRRPGAAPLDLALAEVRGSLSGPMAYLRSTRARRDRPSIASTWGPRPRAAVAAGAHSLPEPAARSLAARRPADGLGGDPYPGTAPVAPAPPRRLAEPGGPRPGGGRRRPRRRRRRFCRRPGRVARRRPSRRRHPPPPVT